MKGGFLGREGGESLNTDNTTQRGSVSRESSFCQTSFVNDPLDNGHTTIVFQVNDAQ